MMSVETDFSEWLVEEMKKRGWNNSELARRADVATSTITNVVNRQKGPGIELCVGIGEAFRIPPEYVLRKAGLLPEQPDETQELLEAQYLFSRLTPEDQERFVAQMRVVLELYRERKTTR